MRSAPADISSRPVVNITAPTRWGEMDDKQLTFAFRRIAAGDSVPELKTRCLMHFGGISMVGAHGDGFMMKQGKTEFYVDAELMATAINRLDFLASIPERPVRLAKLGRHRAVEASLMELPFEVYLFCENLYQGYMMSRKEELLEQMGQLLYNCPKRKLQDFERTNVFYWWASVKDLFAKEFPHFFVVGETEDNDLMGRNRDIGRRMKESTNAQIRALTKGDVTKEKEIMKMDTWRALAELDMLAKEYQEFERKYGSKH